MSLLRYPLLIVLSFWLLTLALYLSNSVIEFPERNRIELMIFKAAVVVGLTLGYWAIPRRTSDVLPPADTLVTVAKLGLIVNVCLLPIAIYTYTGSSITELPDVISNPKEAHRQMVETVQADRSERLPLLLTKLFLSPLTIAVIPVFAVSYFSERKHGLYLIIAVALSLVFSTFRGTDKEFFDAFILCFAGFLVANARRPQARLKFMRLFKVAVAITLAMAVAFAVFGFRKFERMGGENAIETFCFNNTDICYELMTLSDDPAVSIPVTLAYHYLSHGYHGLATAMDADYHGTTLLSHSRPLSYIAERLFGLESGVTIHSQLGTLGWTSEGSWSTGFVWIANDVSIIGVPIVMIVFGVLLRATWNSAVASRSGIAVIVFCYLFYSLIYMPANLQLAQIGDQYFGYLFYLSVFVYHQLRNRQARHNAHRLPSPATET